MERKKGWLNNPNAPIHFLWVGIIIMFANLGYTIWQESNKPPPQYVYQCAQTDVQMMPMPICTGVPQPGTMPMGSQCSIVMQPQVVCTQRIVVLNPAWTAYNTGKR